MTPTEKQARLARLYDTEILPAYAARFAALLLRHPSTRPGARVVEIGCATGALTRELARRFDADSRITAFDESPAFVAEARAKHRGDAASPRAGRACAHADVPASLPLPTLGRPGGLEPGGRRRRRSARAP